MNSLINKWIIEKKKKYKWLNMGIFKTTGAYKDPWVLLKATGS